MNQKKSVEQKFPLIPLRDTVVFPHMVMTLFVGRQASIDAVEYGLSAGKNIFLVLQKNSQEELPEISTQGLHEVGVIALIHQVINLPDGTLKVLVEGKQRVQIEDLKTEDGIHFASVTPMELISETLPLALADTLIQNFMSYANYNKKISSDFIAAISKEKNPNKLIDLISSKLLIDLPVQQEILAMPKATDRLEKVLSILLVELDALKIEEKVHLKVKKELEKKHREYYLNEQLKAIQRELNQGENSDLNEIQELHERLKKKNLTAEARKKSDSELKKLSQMNSMSSEASIVRGYLEWLADLPWKESSKLLFDLDKAQRILDRDHHGLEKVKERIMELLAVQKRLKKAAGQVICLVGPPGVGKTSLGRSIAEATGRSFIKISLGGVRDEAEIRGHRRTYIGAMPGRIIQGMKKAKKSNPLILLDEIDKMGSDWRGDPTSALLEVLDPNQNKAFNDHYLEVDYDLSEALFIATANSYSISKPLLDRMEIIELSGYTEDEKLAIAQEHLLKKVREKTGLIAKEFKIKEEILLELIRHYTRESGVRGLERGLYALARKSLRDITKNNKATHQVTKKLLSEYLGPPRYLFEKASKKNLIGVTNGLSWSESGGDLLQIEATVSYGKGKIVSTGKLGAVMQESIQTALSYVRASAKKYGIQPSLFIERDIHVHAPAGAIPKDGPSAGIAITTSIISALTQVPVLSTVAMTGEISLQGRVLPIGGLKEKLLAALRSGVKVVLIPAENKKDLSDVPENVKANLTLYCVETYAEVAKHVFSHPLKPLKAGQKLALGGEISSEKAHIYSETDQNISYDQEIHH
jgi:ATP-dependent Lon protease